jgi:uncharacterized protein YacL
VRVRINYWQARRINHDVLSVSIQELSVVASEIMADKDVQFGIIILIFATFLLLSGLEMLKFELFDEQFSMFLSFILVAIGVYLIAKK